VSVRAAACGYDGGANVYAAPASCLQNGTMSIIAGNHGHNLVVSVADIQAGADKTYTLAGTDHEHMVTVTAANFGVLASDQSVQVRSTSGGGHTHAITISCR
jgi:hypothetical protein